MKTLAYCACHYGKEYLWYSLKSIADHVDHIIILYSETPTYGYTGTLQNPDTRQEIKEITDQFDCEFIDVTAHNFSRENDHRGHAFWYARNNGYEIVLAVDYDEVWENVEDAIGHAKQGDVYQYGIAGSRWRHFWKSFNEINVDGFYPIRLFNLSKRQGTQEIIEKGIVNHFGYAISDRLMHYKWDCHGHKSELPATWWDKWFNYKRGETEYLHPATDAYWIETQSFDKKKLPKFMRKHPYYDN